MEKNKLQNEDGHIVVESAIIMPVILLCTCLIMLLSLVVYTKETFPVALQRSAFKASQNYLNSISKSIDTNDYNIYCRLLPIKQSESNISVPFIPGVRYGECKSYFDGLLLKEAKVKIGSESASWLLREPCELIRNTEFIIDTLEKGLSK